MGLCIRPIGLLTNLFNRLFVNSHFINLFSYIMIMSDIVATNASLYHQCQRINPDNADVAWTLLNLVIYIHAL